MFGIEILIGLICSLMGIAFGYVAIFSLFMGIQLVSKRKIINPPYEEAGVKGDISHV